MLQSSSGVERSYEAKTMLRSSVWMSAWTPMASQAWALGPGVGGRTGLPELVPSRGGSWVPSLARKPVSSSMTQPASSSMAAAASGSYGEHSTSLAHHTVGGEVEPGGG